MTRDAGLRRKGIEQPLSLTAMEWGSVALALLSLLLLYGAVAGELAAGKPIREIGWILLPHVILIALVVGGLRRVAALVQTFILLAGGVVVLGMRADTAFGGRSSPESYIFIAAIQLPLFLLCFRSGKAPFSVSELAARGPRLALGALVGVIGWFTIGIAASGAAARATGVVAAVRASGAATPAQSLAAEVRAERRHESAERDARARVQVLAACLQQSPATADSQPYFPATLAELPDANCPEAKQPLPEGFVFAYQPGAPDPAGHRRTFVLAARDTALGDAARSFEVDEAMVVRSWHGQGARRFPTGVERPLDLLNQAGRCIESARDTVARPGLDSYPASVAAARLGSPCEVRITADSSAFRLGDNLNYLVHYTAPVRPRAHDAPGGFTLLLEPERDSLGRGVGGALLSFYSDTSGVIHMTRRARAATRSDPTIPDCWALFSDRAHDPRIPCREYRGRQRWGLVSELPTIALSMSGSGTLGIGEKLALVPNYLPLLARDLPVEVRVRWDSGGRDTVLTRRRGVPFGQPIGNGVYFEFHHAWADTGMKQIRVAIRTRGGETFEAREDIRVVPYHP
ncbi:MAG: hypothetical protein ACJ79K_08455 [Gemmatimonadaceae bacterium]